MCWAVSAAVRYPPVRCANDTRLDSTIHAKQFVREQKPVNLVGNKIGHLSDLKMLSSVSSRYRGWSCIFGSVLFPLAAAVPSRGLAKKYYLSYMSAYSVPCRARPPRCIRPVPLFCPSLPDSPTGAKRREDMNNDIIVSIALGVCLGRPAKKKGSSDRRTGRHADRQLYGPAHTVIDGRQTHRHISNSGDSRRPTRGASHMFADVSVR